MLRLLLWSLLGIALVGAIWLGLTQPDQALRAAAIGAIILSIVLMVAANATLVMACYCFVEDAFAEHRAWGLAIVLPPLTGVASWLAGALLTWWLGIPSLANLGFFAGVALACTCPIVCVSLLALRWRQFRRSASTAAGSALYVAAWVLLMMNLASPPLA